MGRRFVDFLRGYAGIGVVWSYVQVLLAYFNEIGGLGTIPTLIDMIAFLGFFFGFQSSC